MAQVPASLQSEKEKIEKDINLSAVLLKETRNNKISAGEEFHLLGKQVENRNKLLDNIKTSIKSSTLFIENNSKDIQRLENNLQNGKENYEELFRILYRQKLLKNEWMYLFSYKSSKDLFLKWSYLFQFKNYAESRFQEIKQNIIELKQGVKKRKKALKKSESLLKEKEQQTAILGFELERQNELLTELTGNEKALVVQLEKQKAQRERLEGLVTNIIANEIDERNKTAVLESFANNSNLSRIFKDNKGKLPWPIENGIISASFGEQRHPTIRTVKVSNIGIDIKTNAKAKVRCIFDGIVSNISFLPGFYNMVIINHGEYRTVYIRLEKTKIKVGDTIKAGQIIGELAVQNGISELQLQIWKDKTNVNPEDWIIKKN